MMPMLAVLALLGAQQPAPGPPVAESAAEDAVSSLAGLQQVYDQSCAAREYGAYDDLCDQLRTQLKAARVEADRETRRKAAEARRHPHAAAKPPSPASAPAAPLAPPAAPSIVAAPSA